MGKLLTWVILDLQVASLPQGEDGWEQKEHVAETIVRLNLVDDNDNDPVFNEDLTSLSLPEDTPRFALLATFTAFDPDNVSLHILRVQSGLT